MSIHPVWKDPIAVLPRSKDQWILQSVQVENSFIRIGKILLLNLVPGMSFFYRNIRSGNFRD